MNHRAGSITNRVPIFSLAVSLAMQLLQFRPEFLIQLVEQPQLGIGQPESAAFLTQVNLQDQGGDLSPGVRFHLGVKGGKLPLAVKLIDDLIDPTVQGDIFQQRSFRDGREPKRCQGGYQDGF
jgi:hypothetical protein